MNKSMVNSDTGEILAVTRTPFLTRYCDVPPTLIEPDPESCVDTTLYQPLNEVIERCERAGMLRELIGGAQGLQYDSKEEISDDVLDALMPVSGDLFEDVNDVMSAYDAFVAASNGRTKASEKSADDLPQESLEAISEQENEPADDVEE